MSLNLTTKHEIRFAEFDKISLLKDERGNPSRTFMGKTAHKFIGFEGSDDELIERIKKEKYEFRIFPQKNDH